ncbi:MAG: transcriptional repressor LexA [Pseudoxanthomonas suwonensis]|nr:transcriptional repressor LexA [Pseudoxanthomonas suwonensis]
MDTMRDDLTTRQRQMLAFIEGFMARHGYAPTDREIAEAFGLASKTGPRKHLAALEAAGYLELVPGVGRGLRLTGGVRAAAGLRLPILGRVAAGMPIGPAHEHDEVLDVDPDLFRTRPDYLLRVKGDSMRDDGILDGDLVAVRQAVTAENGQTVVARIDGEITIKRLHLTRAGIRLLPRNPDYAPIDVPRDADFAIEGLYCGLVRRD